MKNLLKSYIVASAIVLLTPAMLFAQIPNLRSLGCFALFTTTGAIGNTGTSVLTGNIGSGTGAITGFGAPTIVNGSFYNADAVTTQCTLDLDTLCNEINNTINTNSTHAPAFGGGETLPTGVYYIAGAGSIAGTLILDAQGASDALFIFKFGGAFTTAAGTTIVLLNGAKASNIFWKANGAISMAASTDMKGTAIANPGAISMGAGGSLTGRMLSSTGAVNVYSVNVCNGDGCNVFCSPVSGVSTWKGNSNVWNNSCNWCGGIPTDTTDVEIPALLNFYPVLSKGIAMSKNIHIESGASLIVRDSGIFKIYGAVNNAGVFNITDGTLDLAGVNVQIGGSSLFSNTVKNLSISSGALNSISTGSNMLSVKNNLSFLSSNNSFTTNDNLTLLSSDTLTASVTDITNDGVFSGNSIEGNANVERFIPELKRWRYLAINTEATLGSKNTVQDNWMEGATPGLSGAMAGRGLWITSPTYTTSPLNFDAISTTPSVKWLDRNIYTGILDPTNYDIRSHPAYFTYVRGDRGCTATNGIVSTTILRTFGRLIQGDKLATIAAGPDYTGMGNPYASAIDLRKLIFSTADVINIYVWDPKIGGAYGQGAYQHLTKGELDTEFSIEPGGGSYGTEVTMNMIESGLGFLVQGSDTNRTLTFKENAKTAQEHNAYFNASNQQKISASLLRQQTGGAFLKVDGLQIRMYSGYLTSLDFNDARKFNSSNENISVIRENTLLTFEYRNFPTTQNDTIRINMANMARNNYKWIFTLTNIDAPGRIGVLVDKFLATETILDLDGNNSFNFNVTDLATSYATDRFMIILKQQSVLAAEEISLIAKRNDEGKVLMNWRVHNELNVIHYQTEKSQNGIFFTSFGAVLNATNNIGGEALYTKVDDSNDNTFEYYRVKMTTNNQSVKYSEVVKVSTNSKEGFVAISPNPVLSKTIHLLFTGMPKGNYEYVINNKTGQRILSGSINVQNYTTQKSILLRSNNSVGIYVLTLISNQGVKTAIPFNIVTNY